MHLTIADIKNFGESVGMSHSEIKGAGSDTNNWNISLKIGRIYRALGEEDGAVREFEKAVKLSPHKNSLWFKNLILNEFEILEKKTVLKSRPRMLIVSLTTKCNIHCIMCNQFEKNWQLSSSRIEEIYELLPYCEYVSWMGGEVFALKEFKGILRKASELPHLSMEIVSNGILINESWAKLLSGVKIDLYISIDGITKDMYEYIRMGAKFETLLENIKFIDKYKNERSRTGLNFVIMRSNYRQLSGLASFCKKHKFDILRIEEVEGDMPENIFTDKDPEIFEDIRQRVEKLRKETEKTGIKFINNAEISIKEPAKIKPAKIKTEEKRRFFCTFPWRSINNHYKGTTYPWCYCKKSIGSLESSSVMELWNGETMVNYRKNMLNQDYSYCKSDCISKNTYVW